MKILQNQLLEKIRDIVEYGLWESKIILKDES
jgi:hypothetical protein